MSANLPTSADKLPAGVAEKLCELILTVAGRDTNRLPSVRRHMSVLDAAIPYMSKAQAQLARERIYRLEDTWGPLLPGTQNETEAGGIAPVVRVARWLSVRRNPERLLLIPFRAAICVWGGETRLSAIMDYAYAREIDMVIHLVGYDSFREMLFKLRIAIREASGAYRPGNLCRWWIEEMVPSDRKGAAYAACVKLAWDMKTKRSH